MATRKKAKNNHFKIYLLKGGVDDVSDFLRKQQEDILDFDVPEIGTLFYAKSFQKPPSWLKMFDSIPDDEKSKLFNSNTRAVLIKKVDGRFFALTFGYGRSLIKEGVCEPRFGLRVVLNLVNKDSIRSIDKTSLGSVPLHSREQLSRTGSPRDFGINFDEDLIRAVTGKTKDSELGKTVSGSESLSISVPCGIKNIDKILAKCFEVSKLNIYKDDFSWIDQVQEINDKTKEQRLNEQLVQKINTGNTDNVWLAVPGIVDWADIAGFKYKKQDNASVFDDLSLIDFLNSLNETGKLQFDDLRSKKVFCLRSDNESSYIEWSVFQCLYAEIDFDGGKYILTNKSWYEVSSDYVSKINSACDAIQESSINFPEYNSDRFGGDDKDKKGNKGEQGYNKSFVEGNPGRLLMDREMISYDGNTPVEFCDILTKNKEIIHVKRYGGSSSLSHLFQQGAVSGELFKQDEKFRVTVQKKINSNKKEFILSDVAQTPEQDEYEVVFVIINQSDRELDIPFFSKITLQAVARRLRGFGYKVSIKKVRSVKSKQA